jgi:hypothetical protein
MSVSLTLTDIQEEAEDAEAGWRRLEARHLLLQGTGQPSSKALLVYAWYNRPGLGVFATCARSLG